MKVCQNILKVFTINVNLNIDVRDTIIILILKIAVLMKKRKQKKIKNYFIPTTVMQVDVFHLMSSMLTMNMIVIPSIVLISANIFLLDTRVICLRRSIHFCRIVKNNQIQKNITLNWYMKDC